MGEIWKDIEGYEGYYQISNLGRVKSCGRVLKWKNGGIRVIKEKLLFVNIRPNKYPLVTLCKNCIEVSYNIHRLIGEHFIPNPNNYPVVRHLNDIRTDFRIENLAWGTYLDNMKDAFKNNKRIPTDAQRNHCRKLGLKSNRIVLCTETGIFYNSIKEASIAIDINYNTLYGNLSGYYKNKTKLILV